MSKKHKKSNNYSIASSNSSGSAAVAMPHATEYRIIKFDLIKVVLLNAIYLAIILFLYFGNQKSHFLDNWFAKVLHF